jgi:hypothetical protein
MCKCSRINVLSQIPRGPNRRCRSRVRVREREPMYDRKRMQRNIEILDVCDSEITYQNYQESAGRKISKEGRKEERKERRKEGRKEGR